MTRAAKDDNLTVSQIDGEQASDGADGRGEMRTHRPALGALLTQAGIATDEQVKDALAEGMRTGEKLGEMVVKRGWATEERLAQLLAEQWGLRFSKADALSIDPLAIRRLSLAEARELEAVPVWFDLHGLVMAIAEPSNDLFAAVQTTVGDVSYVVVARSALKSLLQSRFFADGSADEETPATAEENGASGSGAEADSLSADARADDSEAVDAEASSEADVDDPGRAEADTPGDADATRGSDTEVRVVLDSIEAASTQLKSIHDEVESLGETLRRTQEQLAEREAQIADLEAQVEASDAALKRDRETIHKLESELAERGDLFDALKAKVEDLKVTLDASPKSPAS